MDNIIIREFNQADRQMVINFFDQMGGETRAFFNRNNKNCRFALSFFEQSQEDKIFFLAEENRIMVGYTFLWDIDRSVPWLGIAVHEAYKGKGLGTRLIHNDIEWARKNQKGGILLTTHVANIRAQALYERMGFTHLGSHTTGELLYLFRF
jgi:ribosomal protein S18 acetylase RimI-like enzyme